jgi:pimeloyl-ACP methyl ester carboxylesterase
MKEANEIRRIKSRDGTSIGYYKTGTGKPILFVHGTAADHRSWARFAPHLGDGFTVYAMDRRGRGVSGDSPGYSFRLEVEDIASVADSIGEPVILFGHSFGGICCLEAAMLAENVSHLILYEAVVLAGVPIVPAGVIDKIRSHLEKGRLEEAMELHLREVAKIPDHELEIYRKSPFWNARIPLASTIPRELDTESTYRFIAEKFENLKMPVLLLLGGDSPSIYREGTTILESALSNSKTVILPGQQHMAHHQDPGLLAKEILAFIRE